MIHRLRADFFGQTPRMAFSVSEANRPPDKNMLLESDLDALEDIEVLKLRVIYREASSIEKHTTWALPLWRQTRSGQQEMLRLAEAFAECADGRLSTPIETLERLLVSAVESALDFAINCAKHHEKEPPFGRNAPPIHHVLAVLAIQDCASALQDFLVEWKDQELERRYRYLLNAQALDKLARDYKARADAIDEAKAEPSRRGQKSAGKPRLKRRTPLRLALEILVARGMTNDKIFEYLGNPDSISGDHDLPIEVCDPNASVLADRKLNWYPRGGNSDNPKSTPEKTIRNLLSEIRNPD